MLETAEMPVAEKTTASYALPSCNMEKAKKKFEVLTRRAAKLGVDAMTYVVTGTDVRKVDTGRIGEDGKSIKVDVEYTLLDVSGDAPKLAGYTFAATIEHTSAGNILRKVPGCDLEAPLEYRDAERKCDHCNKNRRRNDTYLVRNDETGDWKQVGKNCVASFLGCDVDAFLSRLSWWDVLGKLKDLDEEFEGGFGVRSPAVFRILRFLTACTLLVRTEGWMSRAKARETEGVSAVAATADTALWLVSPNFDRYEAAAKLKILDKLIPADEKTAEETLAWVESEWASKESSARSDYEHNVVVSIAAGEGWVTSKSAGLIGSAVSCYLRAMDKLEIRKAELAECLNEHFGEIGGGDRDGEFKRGAKKGLPKFKKGYDLTLKIVSIYEKRDEWGEYPTTFIHKLRDEAGRTFTWFGSRRVYNAEGTVAERGDTFTATWNVKAHNEFKGGKETIINRPRNEVIVEN